jgi:hypothetical protein
MPSVHPDEFGRWKPARNLTQGIFGAFHHINRICRIDFPKLPRHPPAVNQEAKHSRHVGGKAGNSDAGRMLALSLFAPVEAHNMNRVSPRRKPGCQQSRERTDSTVRGGGILVTQIDQPQRSVFFIASRKSHVEKRAG